MEKGLTPEKLTNKECFDLMREIVRHEDGLINNRVSWLLILQGFLLTAFFNGIRLYEQAKTPKASVCVTLGLTLISLLGVFSSLTARNVIRIAVLQINAAKGWWEGRQGSDQFPPASGFLQPGLLYFIFSIGRIPHFLIFMWFSLLGLLVVGTR